MTRSSQPFQEMHLTACAGAPEQWRHVRKYPAESVENLSKTTALLARKIASGKSTRAFGSSPCDTDAGQVAEQTLQTAIRVVLGITYV
jgi:hypothetical protein